MDNSLVGKRFSGLTIVGFISSWFFGPLGLILSLVALSENKHNPETLRGNGLAKWGVAIGILSIIAFVLFLFWAKADAEMNRANERSRAAVEEYNRRNRY